MQLKQGIKSLKMKPQKFLKNFQKRSKSVQRIPQNSNTKNTRKKSYFPVFDQNFYKI